MRVWGRLRKAKGFKEREGGREGEREGGGERGRETERQSDRGREGESFLCSLE